MLLKSFGASDFLGRRNRFGRRVFAPGFCSIFSRYVKRPRSLSSGSSKCDLRSLPRLATLVDASSSEIVSRGSVVEVVSFVFFFRPSHFFFLPSVGQIHSLKLFRELVCLLRLFRLTLYSGFVRLSSCFHFFGPANDGLRVAPSPPQLSTHRFAPSLVIFSS